MVDLKEVYRASNKDIAEDKLKSLSEKWEKKYPVVITSWNNNWHKLSTFFKYTEDALLKLIYLAQRNISKKWTQPLQNRSLTVSQLSIIFAERLKLKILE